MVSIDQTMTETPEAFFAQDDPPTRRILQAAHKHLFDHGYNALTMDVLAHELGMSKKTLYVHFPSKDAIVERIIDRVGQRLRERMDALLSDPKLTFAQKLSGVIEVAGATLARTSPIMLRDLQRFAPHIHEKLDALRQKNIPLIFGRLIRAGIAEGKVRPELDPAFATEFWLHAIRGLVHPDTLDRTQLTPRQTLEKALNLFFNGLLTPAGRKDYEKRLTA
jgi:AcrR family transcriptional regulator